MAQWQVGDRIKDDWRVRNVLRGGMGIVYVVLSEPHGLFALKTFQDEIFSQNPRIAERFKQEAFSWISLDRHQNVAWAASVENIEGKPFLFMEFVGGGDLSTWIGTPRLINNLPQVLKFSIQLCDGMNHALSKGIRAHRDLKSQNCLIAEDHTLKISDFGLARIVDDLAIEPTSVAVAREVHLDLSRTGMAVGTCTHMAPEQFDDAKNVDVRADIYSFGVLLFEMVTGELPFAGGAFADFERQHKSQAPPPLRSTSSSLDLLVARCLAKDPAQRFGSFAECREQLVDIYECLTNSPAQRPLAGPALSAGELELKSQGLNNLGRYAEGLACAESWLQLDPQSATAWQAKGMALAHLRRNQESLDCFDRAIALAPNDAVYWVNLGLMLISVNRHLEASPCFEKALEIDPRQPRVWYGKGLILLSCDRPLDALTWFDREIELDPTWHPVWFRKALTLAQIDRRAEAIICYDRVIELEPNCVEAWCNKGRHLSELDRDEEAIDCYQKAIGIEPPLPESWYGLGVTLAKVGYLEDAIECLQEATSGGHPDAFDALGKCLKAIQKDSS